MKLLLQNVATLQSSQSTQSTCAPERMDFVEATDATPPTRGEVRRLVERHIYPQWNQPRIVDAVTEVLYDHFCMV